MADRVGHSCTETNRPDELKNSCNDDGSFERDRFGSHGGAEIIGDVICANSEAERETEDAADNDAPE